MKTLLAVVVTLAISAPAFAAPKPAPEEGAEAPKFTLNAQDGLPVSPSDYLGQWVVLYFYPKDFTSGCTVEAHGFQKNLAKFEERNAVILGVSGQDEEKHKDFCAKEGLRFKLLADKGLEVSRTYGSVLNLGLAKLSARNTFLIGPDGKIAKRFMKVSPGGHADEVLAAIDALARPAPAAAEPKAAAPATPAAPASPVKGLPTK